MKIPIGRRPRRIVATRSARARRAQGGAALVIALLILLVVSLITLTGANDTLLDQHMASNQYIQTNTFFAAEAGVSQALDIVDSSTVRQALAEGDESRIESAWNAKAAKYENWHPMAFDKSSAEFRLKLAQDNDQYWDGKKGVFQIRSHGRTRVGNNTLSQRTLGVAIKPAGVSNSGGSSPFVSAVVGREGVSVKNGNWLANIDTYNSRYGPYGSEVTVDGKTFTNRSSSDNSGELEGGSTRTCTADATITLSGGTPIYGDVLGTGDLLSQDSPTVYGNVHVNGDANFDGHIYGELTVGGNAILGSNAHIIGDVRAGGDFRSSGDVIGSDSSEGTVTINGDAYFSSSSKTDGAVTAGGNVELVGGAYGKPPSIRAGGTITYPTDYNSSVTDQYIDNQAILELNIDPVESSQAECGSDQSSGVAAKFFAVRNDSRTETLSDWLDRHGCAADSCYGKTGSGMTLSGNNGTLTIGTAEQQTLLEVDSNLSMTGSLNKLAIKGYVTLLVDGTFDLGGTTTLTLGATGTLTLLVTGKTTLSHGSSTSVDGSFVREGADGGEQPAILVDSTYASSTSSDTGIEISGDNDAYIAVYAPDTTVDIAGSGDLYGSVVAKYIDAKGDGIIHYDEALQKVTVGEGGGSDSGESRKAQIVGWWQE